MAEPTTLVLFDNIQASYPLSILSFAVVFLSLYTATSGILQGLGSTIEPVKNMLLGAVFKFALSWFLTASPALHIGGAAFSTVAGFLIASLLNIRKVCLLTGWRFAFRETSCQTADRRSFYVLGVFLSTDCLASLLPP